MDRRGALLQRQQRLSVVELRQVEGHERTDDVPGYVGPDNSRPEHRRDHDGGREQSGKGCAGTPEGRRHQVQGQMGEVHVDHLKSQWTSEHRSAFGSTGVLRYGGLSAQSFDAWEAVIIFTVPAIKWRAPP